ncbi:MAG: TIGR02147 family protein [Pseudobdellovibrionaceae bacterium]
MITYRHLDYRKTILDLIKNKKKQQPNFTASYLAGKIGVQKAYVSKVLTGQRDFNSDQIYLIAKEFQLQSEETEYLLLLLEYERTGIQARKQDLQDQIAAIQFQQRKMNKHIKRKVITPLVDTSQLEYYLEPMTLIVHNFLKIPKYQKSISSLSNKLGISPHELKSIIERLSRLGLIEQQKDSSWKVNTENIHLSRESPLCGPHLNLFKIFANQHIMKIPVTKRFSYSSTIRANEATKNLIHEKLLALLKDLEPLIEKAPEESVYELSFDLFPWDIE